jgi:hypothetical protein
VIRFTGENLAGIGRIDDEYLTPSKRGRTILAERVVVA